MFDLTVLDAASASVHALSAAGQVQAEGLFDTGNRLVGDASTLIKNVIFLAVTVAILVVGFKARWAMGAIAGIAIVGAFVGFLINGGTKLFSGSIDEELRKAAPATSVVLTVPDAGPELV